MTKAEFAGLCGDYVMACNEEKNALKLKEEAKTALLAAPNDMFDKDVDGKEFYFSNDIGGGVRKVVPEPKDILDKKEALEYAKKKEFTDCIIVTESLDEDIFLAWAQGGGVPKAALQRMVVQSTPGSAYIKYIDKRPKGGI